MSMRIEPTAMNGNVAPAHQDRTDKAVKGVLTSFLQYGCQIAMQVLLAPLVLAIAGQETLGAFAVIMQTVGYLALVDLGFSLSMTRFLSQAFGQDDNGREFGHVLSTSRTILFFTNVLFAFLLVLLAFWSNELFSFSQNTAYQAKWALCSLAIWTIIRTPLLIFREGLNASQNMSSANLISIVGNVFRLVFSLGLVFLGFGLVGLVAANVIGEAITLILCAVSFRRRFPWIKTQWGLPDRQLFKRMFAFGRHALLFNIAWKLVSATDNIVVGLLHGATAVSVYYTTQMPSVIGYNLVNRIVDNFGPAINELYAKNERGELKNLFLKLHRYTLLLSTPLCLGILFLNKMLIDVWVGPNQYAGTLMTFSLAGFALLISVGHVNFVFLIAKGDMSWLSRLALVEGGANLGLSLLLGHYIGLPGVMLASSLAHIPMVVYLQRSGMKEFGVDWSSYLTAVLVPVVIPLLIATTCASISIRLLPKEGWLPLGVAASVLLGMFAVFAYWHALGEKEKIWLKQKVVVLVRSSQK